jgi:SSS family transporter
VFTALDWTIVAAYLVVVVVVGAVAQRRAAARDEFFLAGRRMPLAAVAVSVLATALSAATFIGGPQQAYATDLTYLSANLGGLIAVVIVAVLFIPAYYRLGVTSVYELVGDRFGGRARVGASGMFMAGRVLASGARLFMVAIPFALVAFGDMRPGSLVASIVIIAAVAAAYTAAGGIRAIIWTDVLQAVLLVGTVAVAFVLLRARIPVETGVLVDALRTDPGGDKTRVLDLSLDPGRPFTLWTALIGFTLFNLAAFGTDQDLTQRMLTCRSARSGAWSVILSNVMGWPVILLFLGLGLLLHVYYRRPDVMGAAAPDYAIDDSRRVFLEFMLREMPAGLRGLMVAGLFAAAMSSLDSALGAMSSTTIADFYRPWRRRRDPDAAEGDAREVRASRVAVAAWAVALAAVASACVYWQQASGQTLIAFALGVMVFAYAGLLGVFLTALLTSRGNAVSAMAALGVGFGAVVLLQDPIWTRWAPALGVPADVTLAFPWKMTIASALAFAVCVSGAPARD